MCFHSVIFKMLVSIASQLTKTNAGGSVTEKKAWVETTVVVLNGVSKLLATYIHVLTGHESFSDCWRTLLNHFNTLLKLDHLEINSGVFEALREILTQVNTPSEGSAKLSRASVDLVWELWSRGLPLPTSKDNNQDCLLAYMSCFQELYRLMRDYADVERTQRILDLLRDAVQQAHIGSYSADIEYLTPLQANVLESLKLLRTGIKGVPAAIIVQMANFASLAFQNFSPNNPDKQQPTYVALSKESMLLLESLVASHAADPEIYEKGAIAASLSALSKPIVLKYGFTIKTKSTPPWQRATTTAIAILRATLPNLGVSHIPEDNLRSIWSSIIEIANGIISADCALAPSPSTILTDQDFDIASFLSLRSLIIPALGNPLIPDETRRSFTFSLFQTSLIHASAPGEIEGLLATLYTPHKFFAALYTLPKGRTVDPPPSPRAKISYVALGQLVDLVSFTDSSAARIKLAQAAAPYFILRAGLTLRAYIADQPLRGLMPQPLSQRKELLWILKALVELRCEPAAIPDVAGVESEGRKHLCRLHPLLTKTGRVGRGDVEVLGWVERGLDAVGEEFGL